MKVVDIKVLDTIRNIENHFKKCVDFTVPKFIIKNIAILVMSANNFKEAHDRIGAYLRKLSTQNVVRNVDLLSNIKNVFLNSCNINGLWESAHTVDYAKLALEKSPLLGEKRNDRYQLSKSKKRGLSYFLKKGISIKVNINKLRDKYKKNDYKGIPLVQCYNSYRILQINNFSNSKLSHLVHDLFDHMYFFSELNKEKFFSLYSSFWYKVGNPQERDVFSRESELVASIAYERRHYLQNQKNFDLSLNNSCISTIVNTTFGELAGEYTDKVNYIDKKNISVYHIYYNVVCELYEQVRKVGAIKLINDKGLFEGDITMVLKNDYLKIVINVLYFIAQNETALKKMLLKVYSYIESLLYNTLNGSLAEYSDVVNLNTLKSHSIRKGKHTSDLRVFFNL